MAPMKESSTEETARHGRDEDDAESGVTDGEVHGIMGSVKLDMGRSWRGWSRAGQSRAGRHQGCRDWGGAARCGLRGEVMDIAGSSGHRNSGRSSSGG